MVSSGIDTAGLSVQTLRFPLQNQSMKAICNWRHTQKKPTQNETNFNFILPSYVPVKPKSYSLFFSRHSPKRTPSKRSRAKYSPFKGKQKKNLWHFDVNVTVHCESLFAFTARRSCGQQSPGPQTPKSTSISQIHLITWGNLNSYCSKQVSEQKSIYRAASSTSLLIPI